MQNMLNSGDPDLNGRQKMKISFDPFDPTSGGQNSLEVSPHKSKKNIHLGAQDHRLDSPKSVQSDPDPNQRIPEQQQQLIEQQKLV
jgi:hypothetical protein